MTEKPKPAKTTNPLHFEDWSHIDSKTSYASWLKIFEAGINWNQPEG